MRWPAILITLGLALTACRKAPSEAAPVQSSDWLQFRVIVATGVESRYNTKLTLTASGDGFTLTSDPDDKTGPVALDKALMADKLIKAHQMGQLWLPTAERAQGARTRVGTIGAQRQYERWTVWPAETTSHDFYFFEANTGFLVGYQLRTGAGSQIAALEASSIAGL